MGMYSAGGLAVWVLLVINTEAAAADPLTCNSIGTQTHCSDGSMAQRNGRFTYDNKGNSWQRIGTVTYGSDGTTYNRVGTVTYDNRGNSFHRVGRVTYGSDGSSCTMIGSQTYCRAGNGGGGTSRLVAPGLIGTD